ncbi:TPA: hypothetical protein O7V32_RS16190, partial [Escherichia coli]
ISRRQKRKRHITLPSEMVVWQPEFTDKTLSRKTGAVQCVALNRVLRLRLKAFGGIPDILHKSACDIFAQSMIS